MKMRLLKRPALRPYHCLTAVLALATPFAAPSFAQGVSTSPVAAEQTPAQNATLIADSLEVVGRDQLVARGNVEVFFNGQRLRAKEVRYDRKADALTITGPIVLEDGQGGVIHAGSGELDAAFENGLLSGARLILDQRVQLAANQINRVGGRYTQLHKVAATSCKVCETGRPPLWQIRAKRTTHDTEAQQLYFDSAQLRVLDVPILWLPRLRLPDPTLKRATGFLIPSLSQNSQLGFGVRVPYFIRFGDHRDLTVTPYLSRRTRTVELRYRQAFQRGSIEFNGAISNDDLRAGRRGYLFGSGNFDLAHDYKLGLQIEAVTDEAYLLDYDFSAKDRLSSEVNVNRVTRDSYTSARLTSYQSLREGEINSQIPTIVLDGQYERRYAPASVGGHVTLSAGLAAFHRYSTADRVGRDVARLNLSADWQRDWTLPFGLRAQYMLGARADGFGVRQDTSTPNSQAQVTPETQLTLRWPLMARRGNGVAHLLEPLAMIGWRGGSNTNIPNEDSTRSEFDEGNLLNLSRFSGDSRRERGGQAAVGLRWARFGPVWASDLTIGQVYRQDQELDFAPTSGLSGNSSDVLIAGHMYNNDGFSLSARTLLDSGLSANKAEARLSWQRKYAGLNASYIWLGRDAAEDRNEVISEWVLDGNYRFAQHWLASTQWRYDIADDKLDEAKLGLNYRNECVDLNLSLSRRFTSSTNVDASTTVGFTVTLTGFSTGKTDRSYTRSCRT